MKENKKIEEMLLNDENYEKMIREKTEKDFQKLLTDGNDNLKGKYITDIKAVEPQLLFSKFATYEVINRQSKTRSFINGIQAEGYLGSNNSDREKLLKGLTNSFVNADNFVKFIKVKV